MGCNIYSLTPAAQHYRVYFLKMRCFLLESRNYKLCKNADISIRSKIQFIKDIEIMASCKTETGPITYHVCGEHHFESHTNPVLFFPRFQLFLLTN